LIVGFISKSEAAKKREEAPGNETDEKFDHGKGEEYHRGSEYRLSSQRDLDGPGGLGGGLGV